MTTKALISLLIIGLLLTSVVFAVASENDNKDSKNEKISNSIDSEENTEGAGFFDAVMQILAVLFGK